jgi:hypothetical protein
VNLVIGITAQKFAIDTSWEEAALSRRAKFVRPFPGLHLTLFPQG